MNVPRGRLPDQLVPHNEFFGRILLRFHTLRLGLDPPPLSSHASQVVCVWLAVEDDAFLVLPR